jgi:endonuclease III
MKLYFKIFICCFFLSTADSQTWAQEKMSQKSPLEMVMERLDKALQLDNFQKATIQAFLQQNQDETYKIIALNKLDNEKKEMIKEIQKKLTDQIKSVLNPEQIEIFENIEKKDSKTKKKKKKN